ncbi:hypothetical protein EES46_07020 [Streptomyces sp. ADI98-10]|nr:hypothetical protein EES46_07020 [Streptomyces sp. ADI98-10]
MEARPPGPRSAAAGRADAVLWGGQASRQPLGQYPDIRLKAA